MPTPYTADAAVSLVIRMSDLPRQREPSRRHSSRPDPAVRGIVVEVQRRQDRRKRRSWPVYVATFSAFVGGCPVTLLVIATTEKVARWAAKPIKFGEPDGLLRPVVIGPGTVPAITDPDTARQNPELAVLSARACTATRRKPVPSSTRWARRSSKSIRTTPSCTMTWCWTAWSRGRRIC
jgi:hypothetical protein